jgi:hypothetical protein
MYEKQLKRLFKEFDCKVHSQYHVEIKCTEGSHHIYMGKKGLSAKYCGRRDVVSEDNIDSIIEKLKGYDYQDTDLSRMHYLSSFVERCKEAKKEGIFTDAGFKNGVGRVAILHLRKNGAFTLYSGEELTFKNSQEAEHYAILRALAKYPVGTVFSDCKNVVESMNLDRVQWIPRNNNQEVDIFSNMRKK